MPSRFPNSLARAVIAVFLVLVTLPAEAREWKVKEALKGAAKAQDISGIACTSETGFPRKCLVIDDEVQWAQVVIVHEDRIVAGQMIQLISNTYRGEPLELDGEGVAYAGGYFYVMGSHGRPRKKIEDDAELEARIAASSQLIRFRLDGNDITPEGRLKVTPKIETTSRLRNVLRNHRDLENSTRQDLDKYGLTIEGVAIKGDTLYVGLRAPLPDGKAAVATVPLAALFDEKAEIPQAQLHPLTIGKGNGIRDLVFYKGEFIILAGSALALKEKEAGKYFIYRWTGTGDVKGKGAEVPVYPGQKGDKSTFPKPEAILPLGETKDGLRILVIYEGAEEGRPRDLTIGR